MSGRREEKRSRKAASTAAVGFRAAGVAGVAWLISACFVFNAAQLAQLFSHYCRRCPSRCCHCFCPQRPRQMVTTVEHLKQCQRAPIDLASPSVSFVRGLVVDGSFHLLSSFTSVLV